MFQCLNNACLLTRGALPGYERLTANFCSHIKAAKEAKAKNCYAKVIAIELDKVLAKVTDDDLEKEIRNESSEDEIFLYKLPGGNLAVPLLGIEQTKLLTSFVHIRDLKCSVDACLKGKSKLHTLHIKDSPVCRHLLLGMQCKYILESCSN